MKQGKTRQRLLQETVDQLFTGMTQAYGGNCACLGETRPEKGLISAGSRGLTGAWRCLE